ncbi:glycerophosphodiester phosphodiesterase family protein [Neolewinella persica]|uniref:glycerophosphodiester phosphodiesterase family protein n=1 Tax=Neolewinella persica TaxID=70998 RepID=UPI00037695AF|nr:glycerophosphodiester phosphodiesterase family protein [Neolewinella persica]
MNKLFSILLLFSASISYGQNPIFIAHRGGAQLAPENTLAAFRNAVELNADYYELDVKISSDDSLMVMHDATVDRTTNGTGNVSEMTYSELRALDAGSWFGPEFAGEKIPTLSEALEVAFTSTNNIGVVIELKSTDVRLPEMVATMIQNYGLQNRVIVSSFSFPRLAEIKSFDSSIPVMFFATITDAVIDQVEAIGGDWVGGSFVTQALLDYAHSKGIRINIYSLNSIPSMMTYINLGVDGISIDNPGLLIALRDSTPPADVVLTSASADGSTVNLTWEASEDLESGIAGYDIYRGTATEPVDLLESVGNITSYADLTYTDSQPFFYRIKARNVVGRTSVNYSNEFSVSTGPDTSRPNLLFVSSASDANTIVVEFSERIDQLTAETATNYEVNSGIVITSAKLTLDQRSVILSTSTMSDKYYTLLVKNIQDNAMVPNIMIEDTTIFFHKNLIPETVAMYKLDDWVENSDITILDASNNHNDGEVKGGAFITDGYIGNSMRFNGGDDYVQLSASSSFDLNSNTVTLAVWTKLEFLPSEMLTPFGPIFDSENDQYVIYEDRGNKELRFKVATTNSAQRPGISEASLTKGEWIHIVGVYNGSTAKIYLNGIVMDSHNLTGSVRTGQEARLGKSGDPASSSHFVGSIDNVEVYNLALSAEQVMALYNNYKQENLPVCEVSGIQEDVTICGGESYTFPDGTTSSVSTMNSSIVMEQGCFSIINTALTAATPLDHGVTQDSSILIANQPGGTYHWLDCNNNNAEISGATDISYAPASPGIYSVEVTFNGCVDTSDCINITSIDVFEANVADFQIYPNPSTGNFTIQLTGVVHDPFVVEIFNSIGMLVYTNKLDGQDEIFITENMKSGIYIVKITCNGISRIRQLVVS